MRTTKQDLRDDFELWNHFILKSVVHRFSVCPHLIAGWPVRVFGVAVAGLTAVAARHVPGVGCTAVTLLTDHILEAVTLTAAAVAVTVTR